jgi:peptide deformylase
MKTISDLLILGNPLLYEKSEHVQQSEISNIAAWTADLHNVMEEIRARYQFGRAIAAPQLGIMKRLIYMNIQRPKVFINPSFSFMSDEMIEVWDDCMCFPQLFVKVKRHKKVVVNYLDENWTPQQDTFENDLSELIQHEFDHLEGILCTMRAIDQFSFKWRK